jgi:endonuclease/exonuclease/phosphatase family metal-dependent hydrolase
VPQVREKTLTVMSYNIKSGRVTGTADIGKVGDQVARYDPDLVLMQEVDKGRVWSGLVDQSAVLGQQLGMQWTFGGNDVRSPTNMLGNAILSRFPILQSNNVQLPALPGKHRRGLLGALVDVDGIELEVYSTHLEHTASADRERQVAAIAGILGPRQAPRFLGGDFNAVPVGPVMSAARTLATDTWTQVGSGPGLTAPVGRPRVRIDYLMYRGSDRVEITPLRMAVLPTTASDHRAVLATYRLRQDDGQVCVPVVPGTD